MESSNLPIKPSGRELSKSTLSELEFVETLPLVLVSLLERRYLSEFNPDHWGIKPRKGDDAYPLLREVTSLSRMQSPGAWIQAMPHILTACHDPGHSLVTVLHGQGDRHRLYIGGRRLMGKAARSTEDYLYSQESAFKAYCPGLQMNSLGVLNHQDLPKLTEFLQVAPAFAVVTGIPSNRGGTSPIDAQSLDRLVKALGNHQYALMVVAEPMEPWVIDQTLDLCRHLRSEIHAYTKITKTRSQGGAESQSHSNQNTEDWSQNLPTYLFGLSIACQLAGILPGAGIASLARLAGPTQSMAFMAGMQHRSPEQLTTTKNWSEAESIELLDANAEACEHLLQRYIERLQSAKSNGWWQTVVYIAGENESAIHNVSGALRSLCSGEATSLDPIRCIPLPSHVLRSAVERGQILSLVPKHNFNRNPLPTYTTLGHQPDSSFDVLGTCLNSIELAVLVNLPQQEIPGLPVHDWSEFALSVPPPTKDSIELGFLQDGLGRSLNPVTITAHVLNRHLFVTGITGSGKTNTCMQILLAAYEKLNISFLVIEPAKTEYRALVQSRALQGRLRVYSVGGDSPLPFRLNPLSPVPGIPLGRHIDLLKAVFNASFPMFAGMPYVLEEAILEVYTERGWSLYTSQNTFLDSRASQDAISSLTPSLQDLHDKVEVVLARKKYGQEIHQNMGAALRSRLHSLMIGNKGLMLNTRRSVPLKDLFANPTVIELQNLGDDEEKAFVMALLFVLLYEYAEVRQNDLPSKFHGKLQHLTLIEEAHRLLQQNPGFTSAEIGDPRAKAISMFTDMLAEMRAYGEGFIIADQIPTKLTPEIMKNSNIKIIHRLVAPDDRKLAGSCINLTEQQMKSLSNLHPGFAVVHDECIGEAVLTRIHQVKDLHLTDSLTLARLLSECNSGKDITYLRRHSGCRCCPSPCSYYHRLEEIDLTENIVLELAPFFETLLVGKVENSWNEWFQWRNSRFNAQKKSGINENEVTVGIIYCAAIQSFYKWLEFIFTARSQMGGKAAHFSPEARLQREKFVHTFNEFLILWLQKTELDEEGFELFRKIQQDLIRLIAQKPPQKFFGCQACPARCFMLPFVAPHISKLISKVTPIITSKQSVQEQISHLEKMVLPIQQNLEVLNRFEDVDFARKSWLYCLISNIESSQSSGCQISYILEFIKCREDPETSELSSIFGNIAIPNDL